MRRKLFASIILVLLLNSCSPDPTQTESAPQPSPSPTSTPESFNDLGELYESRLESGTWTQEEGLVSMLKFLTTESSQMEVIANAQLTSQAATDILLYAQNYLESGTDPAAKAEIERLLSALVPGIDALDLYSVSAELGNRNDSKAPGLSAQVDCTSFQREGFPADTATECFLRYETAIDGEAVNIYFPAGWGDDERQRQYIEATQAAIADSIATYDGLGLTHRTLYVFFTLLDYTDSAGRSFYASADLRTRRDPATNCMVAVYPVAAGAAVSRGFDAYKQILAHEIFHCYQFWNYNSRSLGVPYSDNKWWVEGTAEYFGNVVYPSVNAEYEYLPGFDRRSATNPILNLDYENFIFFQYMANQIGNAGVLRIVQAMPEAAGSQADALSAFPDIEDLFHSFGRAYLDGEVMDTGGGAIPASPLFVGITFDESIIDAIPEVARFILQHYKLIFPEEHHYDLEVGFDGAPGSQGVRMGGPGTWEPFASMELDQGCTNREMLLLTTTTAARGDYHLLLDVLVEDGPVCDECLISLWHLDNASYEAYWNATPAGEAEGVSYNGVSGLMWANYDEDGNVQNGWTDFTINYTQSFGGSVSDMDFAIILNGTGRANYIPFDGGTLTYSNSVSDYAIAVTMNGSAVANVGITPEMVGGDFLGGPVTYMCTEDTLQFISADFPQLNELLFLRAD